VSLNVELSLLPEPSSAVKSFKVPGDILHIDFHPSGAHFAVTCTITLRDEAFFFRRSTETGEWEQRLDIGLGGSLGNVNSEEVCHDSIYIRMPAEVPLILDQLVTLLQIRQDSVCSLERWKRYRLGLSSGRGLPRAATTSRRSGYRRGKSGGCDRR
jgi:hypothetical protein